MIPVSLVLENFQGHIKSEILFDSFNSALIVGKTKTNDFESNGVGKSTIFKAIEYVLFNKIYAKQSEKIIRDGADFCKVQLVLNINSEQYKIERSKGKKSNASDLRLYKKNSDDTWEDKTQRRIGDNELEIEKLIKIGYDAFKNSILFVQKSESDLASLTSEKRKSLLKDTLQLNHYSKYEKLAKKRASEIVKELDKNKLLLSSFSSLSENIINLEKSIVDLDLLKIDAENRLSLLKDELSNLNIEYFQLSSNYQSLEKDSADFVSKQKMIENQISKLQSSVYEYNKKIETLKSDGKADVAQIQSLKDSLDKLLNSNLRDISDIQKDFNDINIVLVDKNSTIKMLYEKYEQLKIPLPSDTVCKHCRQVLTKEHRISCQDDIDNEIVLIVNKINLLKSEILSLNKNQQQFSLEMTEASKTTKIISDLKLKIESKKKDVENKRSMYSEYVNILSKIKIDLDQKNEEFKILKDKQSNYNIEEFNKLKLDINQVKHKITTTQNKIDLVIRSISEYSAQYTLFVKTLAIKKDDLLKVKDISDAIFDLEKKYKVVQQTVQAFGSAGIPSLIIHNILDDLQLESNNWLNKLKPGIQLKFSIIKDNKTSGEQEDTLDLSYCIHGKDRDYEQISGGQKLAISLSLRLGLVEIFKKQLGVDIKMLLLDEVDQPLDDVGLDSFAEIIKELQKSFKILVITHNRNLKDKFSHAILVEQDENMASIAKLVTSW